MGRDHLAVARERGGSLTAMPASLEAALALAGRRLVAAYGPERVYLFGSRARSDAGPDSDYDLLLVVPDDAAPEPRAGHLAVRALRGTDIAADVLVCTRAYFEARRHLRASLPDPVLRDGRLLYAA